MKILREHVVSRLRAWLLSDYYQLNFDSSDSSTHVLPCIMQMLSQTSFVGFGANTDTIYSLWFASILGNESPGNVMPVTRCIVLHHNEHDGVSNHKHHDCTLNRLFGRISKKTSKLRVTGLCAGNPPVTGEFPTQRTSNAENVSIWWRHHDLGSFVQCVDTDSISNVTFPRLFELHWHWRGILLHCVYLNQR